MDLNEMTRKDFENLPLIKENILCNGLILLPTKRKHDSGYAMFYACPTFNEKVLGKCELYDVFKIGLKRDIVGVDCLFKSKLIRIFLGGNYTLKHLLHWLEQGE